MNVCFTVLVDFLCCNSYMGLFCFCNCVDVMKIPLYSRGV